MFRKSVKETKAYKAPVEGRTNFRRLDFNESTQQPSWNVLSAVHAFLESDRVSAYPDDYSKLHEGIGSYLGIDPACVRATDGADGAIEAIVGACVGKRGRVIIPSPSFGIFYTTTSAQGAEIVKPSYGPNFEFPLDEVLSNMRKARLVVVCNPNNPTGTLVPKEAVERILKTGKAVLVDEVYSEFTGVSCVDLVPKYDNLFVVRSFSKAWALASFRVGYVVSQPQNIEQLNKVMAPYNVNQLGVVAATTALKNPTYMRAYVEEVMRKSKPMLVSHLKKKGVKFNEGAANFMLVDVGDAQAVYEKLKAKGILVRPQREPLERMIRVSVGTVKDTEDFVKAFEQVL